MNTEIESELNQILMAAIQSDISQQKRPEQAETVNTRPKEEIRCSVCCSQKVFDFNFFF